MDYYSELVEVTDMKSTTTDEIMESLKETFAIHGLPESITTDNGPQFVSEIFQQYVTENGIYHRRTTPLWPQANG